MSYNNWKEFFSKISFTFFRSSLIQKKYIETIMKYADHRDKLMEIATGSGYTSVIVADLLRDKQVTVYATDVDEDLVRAIEKSFYGFENLKFEKVDAFEIPFQDDSFDIIFHQGFLEHFSDEEIIKLLIEQGRVAKLVIFDVPNGRRFDKTQEFGNERFLSHEEWTKIAEDAGMKVIYSTARRFKNWWKKYVPVIVVETEWFSRNFGESTIVVCQKIK